MANRTPDRVLIRDLKEMARELGRTPTKKEMTKNGPHGTSTYRRRFGSWNDALDIAGLRKNHEQIDYSDAEWTNEENLRRMYWEEGLSTYEIADRVDGSPNASVVYGWLESHNIERRTNGESPKDSKHVSKKWLREMYWGEGKSIVEMAEMADVNNSTIHWHMEKHGIDRRERLHHKRRPHKLHSRSGYEVFRDSWGGEERAVRVHQLLAISDGADPYTVFDENFIVHHRNGIKWDNRPENLDVMTISEHMKLHAEMRFGD